MRKGSVSILQNKNQYLRINLSKAKKQLLIAAVTVALVSLLAVLFVSTDAVFSQADSDRVVSTVIVDDETELDIEAAHKLCSKAKLNSKIYSKKADFNGVLKSNKKKLEKARQRRQADERRARLKARRLAQKLEYERATQKVNRSMRSGRLNMEAFGKTYFTERHFDNMLRNTGLCGCGKYFKLIEKKYDVNGLFAIAVACLESGNGYHDMGCKNYFGMMGLKFKTQKECIMAFGRLMSGRLYKGSGKTTIDTIAPRYSASSLWSAKVKNLMSVKLRQAF